MANIEAVTNGTGKREHLWRFAILWLPYGIQAGFVTVTLAYVLAQAHVPVVAIAGLAAIQLAPQTWKVLWSPIVDCVGSYKGWCWGSVLLAAAMVAASGFVPMNQAGLPLLSLLTLFGSIGTSGVGMAVSGLTAYAIGAQQKGRASGWGQAGNIGGMGLGGGLGLWLAQHAGGMATASCTLAAICLLAPLCLGFLTEPPHAHRMPDFAGTLKNVAGDLWGMIRSRMGLLALVLVILPIGSGAAANLFAAIAGDWQAGPDTVALTTGALGGVAAAGGSILAGFAADRFDRKATYIGAAFCMAACTVGLAVLPRTPASFVTLTLLYAVSNGFMYAAFFAVTLEAIGTGAAAIKSQLMSCATNVPILLATLVEGAVQTRAGSVAMLWSEVLMTIMGTLIFGLFALAVTGFRYRPIATA